MLMVCFVVQIVFVHYDSLFHSIIFVSGILTYRAAKNWSYKQQKTLHLILQSFAIVISWIGVASAYIFHYKKNIPHFYSLHSWLGITALVGVTVSVITSFLTFYYPKASAVYCKLTLPFHIFGGITNIALSAGICTIGITEKAIFSL